MRRKTKSPDIKPTLEQNYLRLTEHLVRNYGLSLEFLSFKLSKSIDATQKRRTTQPPPTYLPHNLLTSEQAATVLGLRSKTLANWRVQGVEKLLFRRIGGAVRYQYSDLVNFIETRKYLPILKIAF